MNAHYQIMCGLVIERDTDSDGKTCCVLCNNIGADVHEVVPKSHFGRKTKQEKCFQLKNMVVICWRCHATHHNPAGRTKILRILAERYGYDYSDAPWREYL